MARVAAGTLSRLWLMAGLRLSQWPRRRSAGLALGLALMGALAYLPGLGSEGSITQKDEFNMSLRTQVETLAAGRFWTPFLDGQPRFKKPPLMYWALTALGAAFGTGLFVARLPGVAAAVALAWGVAELAGETGMKRDRWKAGLMTLGSMGVFVMGRMALLDVPMAAFATLGVLGALRWLRHDSRGWLVFAAACAGLANMAKGPIGPFVVLAALALRLWVFGQWAWLWPRWRDLALAAGVFAVVGLGWAVAMAAAWGDSFWMTVSSELGADHSHTTLWKGAGTLAFGAVALVAPWSFLLLAGAANGRRLQGAARREALWMALWALACAAPFLVLPAQFERYLAPALAPLILFTVRCYDGGQPWGRVAARATAWAAGVFSVALAAAGVWFNVGWWGAWVVSAALAVGGGWALAARRSMEAAAALAALWLMVTAGLLYPCLGVNRLPSDIGERLAGVKGRIYQAGSRPAFLCSRLARPTHKLLWQPDQMRKAVDAGEVVAVCGEDRPELDKQLAEMGAAAARVITRWDAFMTRKTFLQFTRKGVTAAEWREAFRNRSLDGLKDSCEVVALGWKAPAAGPDASPARATAK
ncbi:MAG TPA: glycosyltransferase family 39 protein [Candidatus Brocadiia bacterium]|nr:glycosyltransferase family 39 protein [Candidatus Brocadiia bacterium]